MKIKLSSIYANQNMVAHPGSVVDVSEAEAKQLCDGGFAVAVSQPAAAAETAEVPAPENAAVTTPETAARRGGKPGRARAAAPQPTE